MIRTPDQRLRVFISSTIQELAEERLAAKHAVEELRLTPVLFEIGARPYPPRDLYQAYLSQSDIFIGIYWNSYGWVAPDMTISGLEDEFRLSTGKHRLMYIKKSDHRDVKLNKLISEIGQDGISYKVFSDAKELQELIENDLALLLSEQFARESTTLNTQASSVFNLVPSPYNPLIGRETEMQELTTLLFRDNKRLVTLLGMGGTGKTRLAIEIAQEALTRFQNGVAFISLASIKDPKLLSSTIAHQMGLADKGSQSVSETLLSYLSDKHLLLVLDNFEQLTEDAALLSEVLRRSKKVQLLVTSRKPLYLRAEHIYPLYPLALPEDICQTDPGLAQKTPSVSLFIERAQSVNSRLLLNAENLNAICILCEKLGGLPLAIELAAMRTRYMTPVALLKGMERTLDILSGGARDLPDRQQSFRATVDWSYSLLSEEEKVVFRIASTFQGGWTLPAIAHISSMSEQKCGQMMEQLIDAGLIRFHPDATGAVRYDMLQPIEEFAEELFRDEPLRMDIERRFVEYFLSKTQHLNHLQLSLEEHHAWLVLAATEYENFRNAFHLAVRNGQESQARRILYPLSILWYREGFQNEGLRWMKQINIYPPENWKELPHEEIGHYAMLLLISGSFRFFPADFQGSMEDLDYSRRLFEWIGQKEGISRTHSYSGLAAISTGNMAGMHHFQESIRIGKECGDVYSVIISTAFIAEMYAGGGHPDMAVEWMKDAEAQFHAQKATAAYAMGPADLAAIVYLEKGNIYFAYGDYETSKQAFLASLRKFEETKTRSTKGYAILSLGVLSLIAEELDEALHYGLRTLNDARETGDNIIAILAVRVLAGYLLWTGDVQSSLRFLREVDGHLYQLKYSSWSVDLKFIEKLSQRFAQHGEKYPFSTPPVPALSFDALMAEIIKATEKE